MDIVYNSNCLKYRIVTGIGSDLSNTVKYSYSINDSEDYSMELGHLFNMFLEEFIIEMGIVLDKNFNFNNNFIGNIKSLFNDIHNNKYRYNYSIGKVLLDFIVNYNKYNDDINYYDSIKDFNINIDHIIYESEDDVSINLKIV